VTTASEESALALCPVRAVRDGLASAAGPGVRCVVDWFAALSEGRLDDAMAMMVPEGPYFLLRQRLTVTNAEFGRIMAGLVGSTFTRPIAWSLGAITEQDDRVAAMAGSHVPLVAGGIYENLYHFLFRIRDGLIFEVYEFGDTFRSAQTFAKPPGTG
jgi:ketosteroid isomerase-like protein